MNTDKHRFKRHHAVMHHHHSRVATRRWCLALSHVLPASRSDAAIFYLCLSVFICGYLSFTPCAAQSQQPLTLLVDDKLAYQSVGLESITESSVGFFDSTWSYQQLAREQVLQLRNIETRQVEPIIPTTRQSLLILTDGQQFLGRMQEQPDNAASTDSSVLHWHSPILGVIKVSLDRVKAMHFAPIGFADAQATGDRVQLANGDLLTGFLLGMTGKELELELGETKTTTKLPLDQVTAVRLANPLAMPTLPRQRVYLVDGSVLLCRDVLLDRQSLMVTGTDWQERKQLPLREIARIDLASPHQQIVSLSSQEHTLVAGAQAFGVDFPPRINQQAIGLHAPTTLRFTLPKGVVRFATDALIDWQSSDPPRARNWTDFVLHLYVDDKRVLEQSFNAQHAQQRINLPIAPGSRQLTIQLTPGLNGPVMDRLGMVEPVLLIER